MLGVFVALACAPVASAAAPANDGFAAAVVLSGASPSVFGATFEATSEPGEPVHSPGLGASVWYSWQAPESGWVTIGGCGGPIDLVAAVYVGDGVGALTRIAGSDANGGGCGYSPDYQASFRAMAGTVYRIALSGTGTGDGFFQLSLDPSLPPSNDSFAYPRWLGGTSVLGDGNNVGATAEPGESVPAGAGGATVWFAWTAPYDGSITLSTCGSGFDARLFAYVGDSVSALTRVGKAAPGYPENCDSEPRLLVGVTAGVIYRFAVDGGMLPGGHAAGGRVFLQLNQALPYSPNDSFANPLPLVGHAGRTWHWNLPTELATKEFGEPNHAGDPGGASLWFTLTPVESGIAEIDTCASNFDTLLAAYRGGSVAALTAVAASDDSAGPACPGTNRSALRFHVDANVTYRVAVDGKGGAEGTLALDNRLIPDSELTPPNTFITRVKLDPKRRLARFHFRASKPGSHFFCQLDRGPRRRCRSPISFTNLAAGTHVLRVTAEDSAGNVDPTPRARRFRVSRPPRD